jgi:FMN-dependent NADH-azoreductase
LSRQLTSEFVEKRKKKHPGRNIVSRDVTQTNLSPIDGEWIGAAYSPKGSRSSRQREVLSVSEDLIAELKTADEHVIGVPMHNFSIPSALELLMDQAARVGETFSYKNGAPSGLLKNKKPHTPCRVGYYDYGSPGFAMNFIKPYLRSLFSFIGVQDTRFINVSGTARHRFGIVVIQLILLNIGC